MHKFLGLVERVALILIGFFIAFNIEMVLFQVFAHTHDVMGLKGIWERPIYYLIAEIAPPLFSAYLWPVVFTIRFWGALILSFILPVLSIWFFEKSSFKKSLLWLVLFYLIVPPVLYLVVAEVVRNFFPFI